MKRIFKTFLYGLYVLAMVVIALEILYRYQIIDFYAAELRSLNHRTALSGDNNKKNLLASGDSFLAHEKNFVAGLQARLPHFNIINTAVIGTSIVEASVIVPGRIKTFDPDIFIYQVYVGNDLAGVDHHLSWERPFWLRNIFWLASERVRVLGFLNYRAGQLWSLLHDGTARDAMLDQPFSRENYRPREKLYARQDPYLISDAVLLQNGREEDLELLLKNFDEMVSGLRPEAEVFIVVIPHKAQVTDEYLSDMKAIGFSFAGNFRTDNAEYPFIRKMKDHPFSRKNVVVVDALPVLQERESQGLRLYYANDEHLNDEGHRLLATQLMSLFSGRREIQMAGQ